MSRQQIAEPAAREVAAFNANYGVGDEVIVVLDDKRHMHTRISHEATVLGGHTAVGWAEDISGSYLLRRFKDPSEFQGCPAQCTPNSQRASAGRGNNDVSKRSSFPA